MFLNVMGWKSTFLINSKKICLDMKSCDLQKTPCILTVIEVMVQGYMYFIQTTAHSALASTHALTSHVIVHDDGRSGLGYLEAIHNGNASHPRMLSFVAKVLIRLAVLCLL